MFLSHFKMKAQPFAERTVPEAFWRDPRIDEGLARLRYLAEDATVGLLTGPSGVGKSALVQAFLEELSGPRWEVIYVHLTHLPSAGLLKLLVRQLDEPPRRGKDRLFRQILDRADRIEGTLVVVIDEAHLLDHDALTDLRLLVSSAVEAPPLKLLLVGQEPLRHTLRQSQHGALLSRIRVRYALRPLEADETASYIDFQLKYAGASHRLFDEEAKRMIHEYAGGMIRMINNLATASLIQAMARETERVSEAVVRETVREFQCV